MEKEQIKEPLGGVMSVPTLYLVGVGIILLVIGCVALSAVNDYVEIKKVLDPLIKENQRLRSECISFCTGSQGNPLTSLLVNIT